MASNIKTRSSPPVWPPPMLACWLPTPLLTISRFSPSLLIKKQCFQGCHRPCEPLPGCHCTSKPFPGSHSSGQPLPGLKLSSSMSWYVVHAYILKASLVTPTIPQKNLNFPQICPKMPQNGPKRPKITQNAPKWPKYDPKWPKMV